LFRNFKIVVMVNEVLKYYLPKNNLKYITLALLLAAAAATLSYGRQAVNLIFTQPDLKNTFMVGGDMQSNTEDYRTCILDRLVQ